MTVFCNIRGVALLVILFQPELTPVGLYLNKYRQPHISYDHDNIWSGNQGCWKSTKPKKLLSYWENKACYYGLQELGEAKCWQWDVTKLYKSDGLYVEIFVEMMYIFQVINEVYQRYMFHDRSRVIVLLSQIRPVKQINYWIHLMYSKLNSLLFVYNFSEVCESVWSTLKM